ncbi:MAG: tetratricopeptide repeat protein, partial [Deltaproteobacteria bacterium]|nr:tetratricopeptide repeat protein [Deltaproteobacteria bacterium]
LLIFPHPSRLNVDYDFALSRGLFNPPSTFLSLLLLTGLLTFALFRAKKNPLFSFSLLWFFVNLAIESSVFPLDMVYEHRLYLPSMGPIMLFAGSIAAFEHPLLKKAGILMGILIALLFSYWTYERNRIWQDPVTLWEDNVKKSPGKARVHGNLGKAYLDKGLYEKARLAFERTIELDPTLLGAYDNLATIYIDHFRDYGRAREFLYEALNRNPDFPSPYLNLGVINLRLKELPEAVKHFEKVLALDPHSRLGHYNLAAARFNQREYDKALSILKKGITLWPRSSMLYGLMGLTYYHKGERAHAGTALTRALELDPSNRMAGACLDKIRQGGHTTPP